MKQNLQGVPETLLIPLWARAIEAKRPNPILIDKKAIEIMNSIEYDFEKFNKVWVSQIGVVVRTEILDEATATFIKRYPEATIINIGCGLDTRFLRVDNGKINWYELDLEEPMRIRKQFFKETERYKMIAKSVFDYSWIENIKTTSQPVLIIAEGILMYFTEQEIQSLFHVLVKAFPQAEMLFEMMTPSIVKRSRQHDAVSMMNASFKWGIKSGKEVEKINPKIKYVNEWNYYDFHQRRWRWMGWLALIPAFKNRFNNRIVHLKFEV